MLKIPQIFKLLPFLAFFAFSSCVKDIDLDQMDEITIPPEVTVDLVYFTLNPTHFVDAASAVQTVSDTTRLDFLDDDYIKESLMRAEFNFKYFNSFPQAFTSTVSFLSENDAVRHSFFIEIPGGSAAAPAVVDFGEIIENSNIDVIRKSIKVNIKVEMHPDSNPVEGQLQLKSKGVFKFEFK